MKKFRIVESVCVYSKKKGSFYRNITIEKDIDTLEEAQEKVRERYSTITKQVSPTEYNTRGLLYPGKVYIKKHTVL
jgi:hypothetical protein